MDELQRRLDALLDVTPTGAAIRAELPNIASVYPFNEFEYVVANLIAAGRLTREEYSALRTEYIARNPLLPLFELGPTQFGDKWGHAHLMSLIPSLVKPTTRTIKGFSGEYDLLLDHIRIECKASRAVDAESKAPLVAKALSTTSNRPFDMNFQQLKPAHCDVFVWMAVFRDKIRYWVLASADVTSNRYYSAGQHRGNKGEGQIHVTRDNVAAFADFEVTEADIEARIRAKGGGPAAPGKRERARRR